MEGVGSAFDEPPSTPVPSPPPSPVHGQVAEEQAAGDEPVAEEQAASDEPVAEEQAAGDEPVAEEQAAGDEPVAEEQAAGDGVLALAGQADAAELSDDGVLALASQADVAELSDDDHIDIPDYKILKAWYLCQKFDIDNLQILPEFGQIPHALRKFARLTKKYQEGVLQLPTRNAAEQYLQKIGLTLEEPCPVPQLEQFTWPVICEVGAAVLRKCPEYTAILQPSENFDDLVAEYVLCDSIDGKVSRKAKQFVLEYTADTDDIKSIHDDIKAQTKLPFTVGCLPPTDDALEGPTRVIAYFRKTDFTDVCQPQLFGCDPVKVYRINYAGGARTAVQNIQQISKCWALAMGNIHIQTDDEDEFSMEALTDMVRKMSKEDFDNVKGRFTLKPAKKRSEFESAFLRIASILQSYVQCKHGKTEPLLLDLLDPPPWVRSLDTLLDPVEVKGSRLLSARPEQHQEHSLLEVFKNPSLLKNFSIGLHGDNESTGFGKTMVSIMLAAVYVKATNPDWRQHLPRKRFALITGNCDAAKLVCFDDVAVWIIDEFDAWDSEQHQFMSESIMKLLLSPRLQCSLRVKGSEVLCVPAGLPRIFTSNNATPEEFVKKRMKWTAPMARKSIWFSIERPLLKPEALVETNDSEFVEDTVGSGIAAELMRDAGH
jgi:hypothetical protein